MPKTKIGKQIRTELGLVGGESRLKELANDEFVTYGVQKHSDGRYTFVHLTIKDQQISGIFKSKYLTKAEALYMFRIETGKKVLK
jgi:hypothetical protein